MLDYIFIQALNGLVIGVIYAVIAAGLTVIFSILKIVNFAHGEVYMIGGYFAYFAIAWLGIPPMPANPRRHGARVRRVCADRADASDAVIRSSNRAEGRLRHPGDVRHLDLSAQHRNHCLRAVSAAPAVVLPWLVRLGIGGDQLGPDFRRWSGNGDACRADQLPQAERLGAGTERGEPVARIRSDRRNQRPAVYMLAFGLGGALAGGAGALVGPIYSLVPSMGLVPDTQAFVIVVLGGMGSVGGSIIAGLLIGVAEGLFVALFPDPTRSLAYAQAFSLLVMMTVLLVRPHGFFGRVHVAME